MIRYQIHAEVIHKKVGVEVRAGALSQRSDGNVKLSLERPNYRIL
jgi:hypothetical protein